MEAFVAQHRQNHRRARSRCVRSAAALTAERTSTLLVIYVYIVQLGYWKIQLLNCQIFELWE